MKANKISYCLILIVMLVLGTGFLANNQVYAMTDNIVIVLTCQDKTYSYNFNENLPKTSTFWNSKKLQKNNRLGNSVMRAETIEKIIKIGYTPMQAFPSHARWFGAMADIIIMQIFYGKK